MDDADRPDSGAERTHALEGAFYRDVRMLERARERLFAPAWHPLVEAAELRRRREVLPFTLLPGWLDEPLVLTRDDGGTLRCLSNVCTHRANVVVTGAGPRGTLRCGYHGRCFGPDGRMLSMPGMEGVADFPGERDHLPVLPIAEWGPLTFCSLGPERLFEAVVAPVRSRLDAPLARAMEFDPESVRHFDVAAHWALYVDNYLEGFHVPFVHPELDRSLSGYRVETFSGGSLQTGLATEGEPALELPAGHPDAGERVAAYYLWLAPGVMLNVYPWGLSLNVVTPLGPESTRVTFASFVAAPRLRSLGAGGSLERVEAQDEAVVEQVQRGIRSRLYRGGRLSPQHEACVAHFHGLLERSLGD